MSNEPKVGIRSKLIAGGWRENPNPLKKGSRCFYKRFETKTRCFSDKKKPGVQIELSVASFDGHVYMEIELVAGLKDGTWMTIHNQSLPGTVEEVMALIPRLLAMWESANLG
jgi:hypothetical protein